jgi:adenine-specific DNA-methyltransferase
LARAIKETITKASVTEDPAGSVGIEEVRLQLARARQLAKAWAETVEEKSRPDYAGAFAMQALLGYAAICVPQVIVGAGALNYPVRLDDVANGFAQSIARIATKLPRLEALHQLTSLYPALLPERYRSAAGAFYTPPCLAARLLDQAEEAGVDWATAKILDPAAGGGAFLADAAVRILTALADCEPKFTLLQVQNRLQGFEIDPRAAALAQVSLEVVLADVIKSAGFPTPSFVRVCDTLVEPAKAGFDLVVGNPPFGRVTLTEALRKRYARSLFGHANLYGIFTDIAVRWAKRGAIIAYLTPTSFLAGQYYSALRRLLATEAPPVAIDFVHARGGVFEDVLQETALAVYKKGSSPVRAQIHYLDVTSDLRADVTQNGTVGLPLSSSQPWLVPRTMAHSRLISTAETMPSRLSDWGYSVSTGPLVWNRHKKQLRHHAGTSVYPLVWAESVTADGRFVYRANKKNHAPYFKIEAGDAWLLIHDSCVLLQRTTAKEQARRLIAAEMPSIFVEKHGGVVVENHLNMLRPIGVPKVSSTVLAALLNSHVVDQVFRCMSGSVAVSAFELEAMPLPSPRQVQFLTQLVSVKAPKAKIEAECRRLYGVSI